MTASSESSAPLISVALCTRNGARYIEEQLGSILAQTLPPNEIVLSDDASTDATVQLARRAVDDDARTNRPIEFTVIENPTALGVTRNFQQAMLATRGQLIVLSDQDDRWAPDRLRRAAAEFERRPGLLLLHGDARLIDGGGAPLGHSLFDALGVTYRERAAVHGGAAFEVYLRRNLATGATTAVRRDLLEIAAAFPPEWVHDEWLAIIAAAVGEVDLLDEPLLDYRQHGANEIGADKLSFRGKVGRVLEPREARNARLARNAEILVDRLAALGARAPESRLRRAEGKLAHERARVQLPAARIRRVLPVARIALRHGYAEYGRGPADALRDLAQPADRGDG